MPSISERQRLILELEQVLQLLSLHYAFLVREESEHLLVNLLCSDSEYSSNSTRDTSHSGSTSNGFTASSSSFGPVIRSTTFPLPSDPVLEAITGVYGCYQEVISRRYLDRTYGSPRQLHLYRDQKFQYLLNVEPRAFRYMFRMNRATFDNLYNRISTDPVFRNNSNSPQVNPRYQLAVALSRMGHDGNGSAV